MRSALVVVVVLACTACGGRPRASTALAADLDAIGLEAASERAPDLAASARAALEEARASEDRDAAAAADAATLARLYAEAAVEESARLVASEARVAAERATLEAESELHAIESTRSGATSALARLAAARTAREEGARALARAEIDEARPGRARQDSLSDVAEMRQAAHAIRDRARLLAAAATALGATPSSEVDDLIAQSERAEAPLDAVRLADRAHGAARARLAAARRAHAGVDAARIASLVEAADSEGFRALRFERGTGIELDHAFDGSSSRPSHAAEGRLARLATLIASYPDGPLRVEIDSPTTADAVHHAAARAASVVHALVAGGVDASRVAAADPIAIDGTPTPGSRVRVVLVSYVETPPASLGAIPATTAPPEAASVESE